MCTLSPPSPSSSLSRDGAGAVPARNSADVRHCGECVENRVCNFDISNKIRLNSFKFRRKESAFLLRLESEERLFSSDSGCLSGH